MFLLFIWALASFYSVFSTAYTHKSFGVFIFHKHMVEIRNRWATTKIKLNHTNVTYFIYITYTASCQQNTFPNQPQTVPLEVFRHPPCCWPMRNLASHVSNHLYALIPLQDCYNPCVYCWLVEKQHPLCSKQAFFHCPLKPQRSGVRTPFTRIPLYE